MNRAPSNTLVCKALTEATFCCPALIGELHFAYYGEADLSPLQLRSAVRRAHAKAAQLLAAIDIVMASMDRPADEAEQALQAAE